MTTTTSFLPEDYLDQKAERRTNLISLSLQRARGAEEPDAEQGAAGGRTR
ncbi:MAG: hypothetical protein ACYTFF_17010 [Planctomycetota bacterium]